MKSLFTWQVFSRALIWFSVGGSRFRPDPVAFEYMPDGAIRESRNISMPIQPHQPGKFVKIQFFFDDIWMLMSEISFDWTDQHDDGFQTEAPFYIEEVDSVTEVTKRSSISSTATKTTTIKPNNKKKNEVGVVEQIVETETSSKSVYMEIVVGVLTATCLLLLFLFLIVVAYSRRQKFLNSPASRSLNPFPVQINMKVRKEKEQKFTWKLIFSLSSLQGSAYESLSVKPGGWTWSLSTVGLVSLASTD